MRCRLSCLLVVAGIAAGALASSASAATASCAPRSLAASFAVLPFSQGAGNVEYVLTITNRGGACRLTAPRAVTLLGSSGRALPSNVGGLGAATFTLARGQYAQADARFSPDVTGPGETGDLCEPATHALRLSFANGDLRAPADPTPVCEHGTITFRALRAVAPSPACRASALRVTLTRQASAGETFVDLTLRDAGQSACHTSGFLGVTLLSAADKRIPTRTITGVPSPYRFGPGARAHAMLRVADTTPGGSNCIAATGLALGFGRGDGVLVTPLLPATMVCGARRVTVSGLYG